MNSSISQPTVVTPVDPDLAEQAVPGHGVPSQDPNAAAQIPINPEEAERESNSALMGGGMVAGTAAGAALGAVVAGPVGVLIGGTLGAVAGAIGIGAAGELGGAQSTTEVEVAPKVAQDTHRDIPPR